MASATISDATPAATPAIEMPVITPMTAWRLLARRYRVATKSSKRMNGSYELSALSQTGLYPGRTEELWYHGWNGSAIRPIRISESLFQLNLFHPDHHCPGHDCKYSQPP